MSTQDIKKKKEKEKDMELNPEKYFVNSEGHIRDRIVIHDNPKIPKEGLFVSLNGFAYQMKPGVEIDIPRPVRKMIDTRVETETQYSEDGTKWSRDIPRISYTLIKEDVGKEEAKVE